LLELVRVQYVLVEYSQLAVFDGLCLMERGPQVLMDVSGQLEKYQDLLVSAAQRQDHPKGAFTSDGKGVKALGVLPQTEVLASDALELAGMLKNGLDPLTWWWPWTEAVRVPLASYDHFLSLVPLSPANGGR
jgi:hypothetical protein